MGHALTGPLPPASQPFADRDFASGMSTSAARRNDMTPGSNHLASVPECDEAARLAEWRERPLGRLGRRLLPEIELYLEFFAIARAD
jgi:hypothetical protein